jgi:hypothetical protein
MPVPVYRHTASWLVFLTVFSARSKAMPHRLARAVGSTGFFPHNEHIRLLLKRGDWGTAKLLLGLERCKYTECFFKGYAQQPNHGGMRWNRQLARAAAEETNLFKKKKTGKAKKRSKRR